MLNVQMAATAQTDSAFVLHALPYKETSLVVELFCRHHGRMPVVAKGAKRPNSALRSVLLSFIPLGIRFSGKGDVKTLTRCEWLGQQLAPTGPALFAGYYLNELLMQGLLREDPHPELFDAYAKAMQALSDSENMALVVRTFELTLLAELGFGISWASDAFQAAIAHQEHYAWWIGRGWWPTSHPLTSQKNHVHELVPQLTIAGEEILHIGRGQLGVQEALQLKKLTRYLIQTHIASKTLNSRAWMEQLARHDKTEQDGIEHD